MSLDALDSPFTLRLNVEQKNKPSHVPVILAMSIRTTLRHTPSHLMHLIWLFSEKNHLKPLFLRLSIDGVVLPSSAPLLELLNTHTPSENLAIALAIDYTLFESPFLPKAPPVADQFGLEVSLEDPDSRPLTARCQGSLPDTIAGVKRQVRLSLKVAEEEIELIAPVSGQILRDDTLLRDAIGLDVPPLQPVLMKARKRVPECQLRVFPIGDEQASQFVLITASTTVCDLREKVALTFDVKALLLDLYFRSHCFSKAISVPSQLKLLELFSFVDYTSHAPYAIGFRCTEPEPQAGGRPEPETAASNSGSQTAGETPEQNTVLQEAGPDNGEAGPNTVAQEAEPERTSELQTGNAGDLVTENNENEVVFELDMNGQTVVLSRSECRICDGNMMLSPEAVAKLNEQWNIDVAELLASSGTPTRATNTGQELNGTTELQMQLSAASYSQYGGERPESLDESGLASEPRGVPESQNENESASESQNENESVSESQNESGRVSDTQNQRVSVSEPRDRDVQSESEVEPASSPRNETPGPVSSNGENPDTRSENEPDAESQSGPEDAIHTHDRLQAQAATNSATGINGEADPMGEGEQMPARGAFRTVISILVENRVHIMRRVAQVLFAAFLMTGESILVLAKTSVLVPLSMMIICIACFSFGNDISAWLDEKILSRSTPNTPDYNAVRLVSLGFREANGFNTLVMGLINGCYIRVMWHIHTPRYLVLEQRVFGIGADVAAKSMCHEVISFVLMCMATIHPTLEHLSAQLVKELAREDENQMKRLITGYLKKLDDGEGDEIRRQMQEKLAGPIESVATEDDHYADRLRLYLMLVWVVKRRESLEVMPALR